MTIYRGPGGTGTSTSDIDTTEFQEFVVESETSRDLAIAAQAAAEAAQAAAEAAQTAAELAETNAELAETNAELSETNAAASAVAAANIVAAATFGFRNRIINGDMRIDQRNAGASVSNGTGPTPERPVDRWTLYGTQASKCTGQRNAGSVTLPNGYTNYLGITSSSAYSVLTSDHFSTYQRIEGFNTADLNWGTASAQTITLSFWVRSSLTGTFGGALTNNAFNRSYPFSYTISAANTWELKTITISGDTTGTWATDNSVGIGVYFGLGVGATYSGTAGAWTGSGLFSATGATSVVGTNGATFYITGVQLEAGTVASPFERRDYGRELIMCQRYYEKSFPQNTAPNNSGTDVGQITFAAAWGGSSAGKTPIRFAVVKRATPTLTKYGDASGRYAYLTSGILPTTETTYNYSVNLSPFPSTDSEFCLNNQATQTTLFCIWGGWTASSEL